MILWFDVKGIDKGGSGSSRGVMGGLEYGGFRPRGPSGDDGFEVLAGLAAKDAVCGLMADAGVTASGVDVTTGCFDGVEV